MFAREYELRAFEVGCRDEQSVEVLDGIDAGAVEEKLPVRNRAEEPCHVGPEWRLPDALEVDSQCELGAWGQAGRAFGGGGGDS